METKKLFKQLSNMYQASQVLQNLKVAFYMHDLEACEALVPFYRKLHGDKVANELLYWCKEDCENGLKARIEKEHYRFCLQFHDICGEMQSRFDVGVEAWNEELLVAFARVFFTLGHDLQLHPAMAAFVKISEEFLANLAPEIQEVLNKIFKELMGYSGLSVYLNDMVLYLEQKQYSEDKKQEILEMFGVYMTKIVFDEPSNERRTDMN